MDYENLTTEGVSRLSDNKLRDTWNDLGIAPASLTPTSRPFMEKKILSVIREKNSLSQKTFKRVGIVGEAVAVHEESPFADSSEATVMNDVHQNGEVIELFEYVPNTPIGTKHHNRSDDTPFPEKNASRPRPVNDTLECIGKVLDSSSSDDDMIDPNRTLSPGGKSTENSNGLYTCTEVNSRRKIDWMFYVRTFILPFIAAFICFRLSGYLKADSTHPEL